MMVGGWVGGVGGWLVKSSFIALFGLSSRMSFSSGPSVAILRFQDPMYSRKVAKTYHSPKWSFLIMIDPTILAGNTNLVLRTFHG